MSFTERTQVLLSPEQRARLERLARRQRRSVGAVVRDAIDAYAPSDEQRRREALAELLSLDAPVPDWPAMKRQIIDGATPPLPG